MKRRLIFGLFTVAIALGIPVPAMASGRTHTVFTHTGYGKYTSSYRNVRSYEDMEETFTVTCKTTNYGANFYSLLWQGNDRDSEDTSLDFSTKTIHGADEMLPFADRGRFIVYAQPNCKVVVKVTQTW